jgi:hypothetical protein
LDWKPGRCHNGFLAFTGAVIGVGGGRDVLSQRLFGVSDVTGIEINPIIIDVLEHHISDYTPSRSPRTDFIQSRHGGRLVTLLATGAAGMRLAK